MKVFVLGGSGFIGGGVAQAFRSAGYQVTTLSRTQESANRLQSLGYRALVGDMARPGAWLDALAGSEIVVYAAQSRPGKRLSGAWVNQSRLTRNGALDLILPVLKRAGPCRALIYTSGIVAVGDHGDAEVSEASARVKSALGDFHAEGEAIIGRAVSTGIPAVVLRPGFVYGPSGSFADFFIREAQKGFFPYPGGGTNFIPWVHIDDLAEAYVLAAAKVPVGEVIHIVDDQAMRLAEFARLLMGAVGGGRSVGMPKWLVSMLAGAPLVEILTGSYRAGNDKAKAVLGWKPRHRNLTEGLPAVIKAYAEQAVFQ